MRIDALHTVTEFARKLSTLELVGVPTGNRQSIGGKVSLLLRRCSTSRATCMSMGDDAVFWTKSDVRQTSYLHMGA